MKRLHSPPRVTAPCSSARTGLARAVHVTLAWTSTAPHERFPSPEHAFERLARGIVAYVVQAKTVRLAREMLQQTRGIRRFQVASAPGTARHTILIVMNEPTGGKEPPTTTTLQHCTPPEQWGEEELTFLRLLLPDGPHRCALLLIPQVQIGVLNHGRHRRMRRNALTGCTRAEVSGVEGRSRTIAGQE